MGVVELVRASLIQYRPTSPTELGYRERCLRLCEAQGDPCSRAHFEPGHFTASAFVFSTDLDRLLLIRHRKLGRWLQPGGHFEPGDTSPLAAALRELAEETGLRAVEPMEPGIFDLDIHAIPPLGVEPSHEHFDLRLLFRASAGGIEAGVEVAAARWFPLDDVETTLSDGSVARVVHKLRGRD